MSVDECRHFARLYTRQNTLIINAVQTKSAECRQIVHKQICSIMLSQQTTLEPMTRRKPYVSYKQGVQPCLSLCKKTRRQPYVTYVAYVLMSPAVSGIRANSP